MWCAAHCGSPVLNDRTKLGTLAEQARNVDDVGKLDMLDLSKTYGKLPNKIRSRIGYIRSRIAYIKASHNVILQEPPPLAHTPPVAARLFSSAPDTLRIDSAIHAKRP